MLEAHRASRLLAALSEELVAKQRELASLQQEQACLQHQHQLLQRFCDNCDWYLQQLAAAPVQQQQHPRGGCGGCVKPAGGGSRRTASQQTGSAVSTAERQLLHQLGRRHSLLPPGSPTASCSSSSAAAPSCASCDTTLSARSAGPFAAAPGESSGVDLFRYLAARPFPGAERMSFADVQADTAATVRELALNLQLFNSQQANPALCGLYGGQLNPPPSQRIQDLLCRHMHLLTSLSIHARRGSEVLALMLTNMDTGERMGHPDIELHRQVLQQLQLTAEQQQGISCCMQLAQRLELRNVAALQRIVHEEMAVCSHSDCSGDSGSTGAGSSAAAGASAAAGGSAAAAGAADAGAVSEAALPESEALLALLQGAGLSGSMDMPPAWSSNARLVARVERQLRKDMHLRVQVVHSLYGTLSFVQLAKLHIGCYPFLPTPPVFGMVVHQHYQQQQQAAAVARGSVQQPVGGAACAGQQI